MGAAKWWISIALLVIFVHGDVTSPPTNDSTGEDCTLQEAIAFGRSAIDMGIIAAAGCDFIHIGDTEPCCAAMAEMFAHPCANLSFSLVSEEPFSRTLDAVRSACGVYIHMSSSSSKYCGNGIREGWEKCDDGNKVPGDGCSECLVETGYSCGEADNGTDICRICSNDCRSLNRQVCVYEGGPCGECREGFYIAEVDGLESAGGKCGDLMRVFYVVVDDPSGTADPLGGCNFTYLGDVVVHEPRRARPHTYIEVLDNVLPNRTRTFQEGVCSLENAVRSAPIGMNRVALIEIAHDVVHASDLVMNPEEGMTVCVFSDRDAPAVIVANQRRLFDVWLDCTLQMYNLVITNAGSVEGAAVRAYGGWATLENIAVHNTTVGKIPAGASYTGCYGNVFATNGVLTLRNVIISNNIIEKLPDDVKCLVFSDTAIIVSGDITLDEVTFADNIVPGSMMTATSVSDVIATNIYLQRNLAPGALLMFDGSVVVDCITATDNDVLQSIIQITSVCHINSFVFDRNVYLGSSVGSLLANFGTLTVRNGVATANIMGPTGVVVSNRSTVVAQNLTVVGTDGGVLETTGRFTVSGCTIRDNTGAATFGTIKNAGVLILENCVFDDLSTVSGASTAFHIESLDDFIVRDSIVPRASEMHVGTCLTELPKAYFPSVLPCGLGALCTESGAGGVSCACPSGTYGDPTLLCKATAELFALPDSVVTVYHTKSVNPEEFETSTEVRLLADGLGTLVWAVDNRTVPAWLSLVPSEGVFSSYETCPDDPLDATLLISSRDITGSNREQSATVDIVTSTTYIDPQSETTRVFNSTYPIVVNLKVDIIPSAVTSSVQYWSECETVVDGQCQVEAGTEVTAHVDLRDSAGYSLGVGGDSFEVYSSSTMDFSREDLNNGAYVLTFDAPQEHFFVNVTLWGQSVQGSPLRYHIRCSNGDYLDINSQKCKPTEVSIPRHIIAIVLGSLFVFVAGAIRLLQKRKLSLAASFLQDETTMTVLAIFMDVLDLGTDTGVVVSVVMTDSLVSYVPYYLSAFTIATLVSCSSIVVNFRALHRMIFKSTFRVTTVQTAAPAKSVAVIGGGRVVQLHTADDIVATISVLSEKRKRQILGVVVLFVEDIPFQVLNSIVLCSSGANDAVPLTVLFSLQITMILIGIKATKAISIRKTSQRIQRLRTKLKTF